MWTFLGALQQKVKVKFEVIFKGKLLLQAAHLLQQLSTLILKKGQLIKTLLVLGIIEIIPQNCG